MGKNNKNSSKIQSEKLLEWQKARFYKIKHFIFDFGGVLLIGKTNVLKKLFARIEDDFNYNIYNEDKKVLNKLRRQLRSGRMTSKEFLEGIFNHIQEQNDNTDLGDIDIDDYEEFWIQSYMQLTKFNAEMGKIIQQLHHSRYKVSLMSNTIDIHAKGNELKGFYDLFDHVFLSNEIGLRKPDLNGYKYVLNQLKTTPEKCIFIDDKLKNVIPAKKLGMLVIKFETTKKFKALLDDLDLLNLTKEKRRKIKNRYRDYKTKKREFLAIKREYLQAKKEFLEQQEPSIEKKEELKAKEMLYQQKKAEYKKHKKIKKADLMKKFKGM